MCKKKVLFVNEASYLNTGYAVYGRNVMQRMHESGKYDLYEFSIYGKEDDPIRATIPWKNYPNMPLPSNEEAQKRYASNTTNQFGAWRFDRLCSVINPDVVISIRDFWMDSFINNSPYRRIFKHLWMPTVDASPQHEEWIHVYAKCDSVFTYSDWAKDLLNEQSGGNINLVGSASPSASDDFKPKNKAEVRELLGVPQDALVFGTVMRNQRRKLFPALFSAFKRFLDDTGSKNTYLLCHTSYPDNGWDIADLILQNEVSSRVLFTYVCSKCKTVSASLFKDALDLCDKCNSFSKVMPNVHGGISDEDLCNVYNAMDLYIQCANSEGFGMPQIEAAACAVPLAVVNYSAMEDMVNKLGAIPIEPAEVYKELETGCNRAVPSTQSMSDAMKKFYFLDEETRSTLASDTHALFRKQYSWDSVARKWMDEIDKMPAADWSIPPVIRQEKEIDITNMTNRQFIEACCNSYMINPNHVHSHEIRCINRDLNFGKYRPSKDGYYHSEFSAFGKPSLVPLDRKKLIEVFLSKLKISNFWEKVRIGSIKIGDESWLK